MIDLTPFMREDILLNLPAHPHCDRKEVASVPQPKRSIVIAEAAQTLGTQARLERARRVEVRMVKELPVQS